jgi:hypothetical protein
LMQTSLGWSAVPCNPWSNSHTRSCSRACCMDLHVEPCVLHAVWCMFHPALHAVCCMLHVARRISRVTQPNDRATNVENKANRRYLSVDVDSQNCAKLRLPTSRVRRANAARTQSLAGTAFSGTGAAQTTVICCRYRWLLTQTGQFTTNPNRICHKSISAFFFLRSATPLYFTDSNFNARTTNSK